MQSEERYLQMQYWGFTDEVKEMIDRADRGTIKNKRWEFLSYDQIKSRYKHYLRFPAFKNRTVDLAIVSKETARDIVCCWDPITSLVWYREDGTADDTEKEVSIEIAKRLEPDENHLCPFSHLLHRMEDESDTLDMENIPVMPVSAELLSIASDIVKVRQSLK